MATIVPDDLLSKVPVKRGLVSPTFRTRRVGAVTFGPRNLPPWAWSRTLMRTFVWVLVVGVIAQEYQGERTKWTHTTDNVSSVLLCEFTSNSSQKLATLALARQPSCLRNVQEGGATRPPDILSRRFAVVNVAVACRVGFGTWAPGRAA